MFKLEEAARYAVARVVEQGCLSRMSKASVCSYRLKGNKDSPIRCASGWLIPDNEYDLKIEGAGCYESEVCSRIGKEWFDGDWLLTNKDKNALSNLQKCHDLAEDMDDFKHKANNWFLRRGFAAPFHEV